VSHTMRNSQPAGVCVCVLGGGQTVRVEEVCHTPCATASLQGCVCGCVGVCVCVGGGADRQSGGSVSHTMRNSQPARHLKGEEAHGPLQDMCAEHTRGVCNLLQSSAISSFECVNDVFAMSSPLMSSRHAVCGLGFREHAGGGGLLWFHSLCGNSTV
jgi:hypothetical protein